LGKITLKIAQSLAEMSLECQRWTSDVMDTYDMYPIIYVGIVRQRIRQRGTNELKMKKTNDVFILTGQQYYSG